MNRYLTAITTYGTPAYVHLGLEHFRRHSAGLTDVIVCDDHSEDEKLKEVCGSYAVPLLSLPEKSLCQDIGDMRLLIMAMEYAKEHGYTHLLKLSRSMILKRSPFSSLDWLIEQSGGWTFTNRQMHSDWGFKTSVDCYAVDAWWRLIPEMRRAVAEWEAEGEAPRVRVETCVHRLARIAQPSSEKYIRWTRLSANCPEDNGYVHWDWIGEGWKSCPDHVMWHDYFSPANYLEEARRLGIQCYTEEDFRR